MSVYHSIRSAQEATESFVNLDLGVEESQLHAAEQQQQQAAVERVKLKKFRIFLVKDLT